MPADPDPRERVFAATVRCAGQVGLKRITVEAVATEAGVSRASVYRWFPGGRDQLVDEAITWEVGRFLTRLAEAVEEESGLAAKLERALMFVHKAISEHHELQKLLATEPGGLLPHLHDTAPIVVDVIRSYLEPLVTAEPLQDGVDSAEAADYLARMVVSFIINQGSWDLSDPDQVRDLVHERLLAGLTVTDATA